MNMACIWDDIFLPLTGIHIQQTDKRATGIWNLTFACLASLIQPQRLKRMVDVVVWICCDPKMVMGI